MAENAHQPAPNAPVKDWQDYLRGTGHVAEDQPKPFGNYVALHGYWVPPRIAGVKPHAPAPEIDTSTPEPEPDIDPSWYTTERLVQLRDVYPNVYKKLPARMKQAAEAIKQRKKQEKIAADAQRLAEQRHVLETSVEARLINRQQAEQQLAEWARANGIALPSE